ncbi:MAG: hypothetical protein NT062_10010 [Proteobacteria bacterium]|nr:hypothetical protein [Pseudomonadota bacterium]
MRRLLVLALLVPAATARADSSVTVDLNARGQQLASELGLSTTDLIATAQARIDELYKTSRLGDLLHAFANTAAIAQRGLGVDYDPDPGDRLIGVSIGGVHGDVAIGTTNTWLGGSIINLAAMAGVNLGRWQHPRWMVFANGFYESTTIHGLDGSLLTLGAHVQYHLVRATGPGSVRWTGVQATTGLEYASWVVGTATGGSIESHFIAKSPTSQASIHMSSTGTLDVDTTTVSVPLELTTGVRLLDALVLYTGGGLDLTAGSSTVVAQLTSQLSINKDKIPIGTAVITGSGSNSPSAVTVHGLAGLEIHTRRVRVVFQTAVAPGELAVNVGLRVAL